MFNLGNVAGVVKSPSQPLEDDGVTVKKYVLWAKPVGNSYTINYWDYRTQEWETLGLGGLINDESLNSLNQTYSVSKIRQLLSTKLDVLTIVDDLVTDDATKALSAAQGVQLKAWIDALNNLLASDDTALDELQEIVNYIKANKTDLQNLSVSNISGLQTALDSKVDKVTGKSLTTNDFTNLFKTKLEGINLRNEQLIDLGGNYHNLTLTGNVIVFTNVNAQAIITGFDSSLYKKILIVNKSGFENSVVSESLNSLPENRISLLGVDNIGIEGAAEFQYVESIQRWQLTALFATKFMAEFRGVTQDSVPLIQPGGKTIAKEITEIEDFRDAQSTAMTKAELNDPNTGYPEQIKGFEVICKQLNTIYKKMDSSSNSEWKPITMGNNVV